MKSTIIILSIMLLPGFRLAAQPFTEIRDVDILANQHIVLHREYPQGYDTVEILGTHQISPRYTKVYYMEKGVRCEAILNSDTKDMLLVATGVYIPRSEVPGPVMDAFKKSEHGDWEITNTLAMRTPYGPWFYAIDVQRGDTMLRIFYDSLGDIKIPPY